ncbi:MAG: hypothetical protein J5U17_12775 [Candidatus Methanoperedens sp.]|nr:hypothetical protein [Candidatus Methanoperedens sp.]MCE8429582.1 hypothetical protein [Candidatus Methanoperedens sp.]
MKIRIEIEGKNAGNIHYRGPDSAEEAVKYLNSIEANELQISLSREDGTKAFAEFEGEFCRQSATKFIMSASKPVLQDAPFSQVVNASGSELTLKERLEMFLRYEYPRIWFSSLDVKKKYETVYGHISLSTVSTYLARMYRDNKLERKGNRNQREYRFMDENTPLMNNILVLGK